MTSDPDQLLKSADLALYRAKGEGRGRFRFFETEMDARMQARRGMEVELRKALDTGQFELYYQPLIDLRPTRPAASRPCCAGNTPSAA